MGIGILRCQVPGDLQDSPVNLDAKEVFGLSGDFQCRLECDDAVDIRNRAFSDIGVAVPGTVVLPGDIVSSLAVLHDSRYPVIVIGLHIVVALGFFFCLCDFLLFLLSRGKFRFQPVYLRFVLIVFLTERNGILHTGIGNLFDKRFVFLFQCGYL